MKHAKNLGVVVVVAALLVIAWMAANAMIRVDGRDPNEYECDGTTYGDNYCECMRLIGDERYCGASKTEPDGGTTSWNAGCTEDWCTATVHCSDGETVLSCSGEYSAQADEAGVICKDVYDSSLATTDYCPE